MVRLEPRALQFPPYFWLAALSLVFEVGRSVCGWIFPAETGRFFIVARKFGNGANDA